MQMVVMGEDTELDKTVIEEVSDPMMHLIRNAVSHGIESSKERVRLGNRWGLCAELFSVCTFLPDPPRVGEAAVEQERRAGMTGRDPGFRGRLPVLFFRPEGGEMLQGNASRVHSCGHKIDEKTQDAPSQLFPGQRQTEAVIQGEKCGGRRTVIQAPLQTVGAETHLMGTIFQWREDGR